MRTGAMVLTALLAGCASAPDVAVRDDAYLGNKSLRFAVLDVFEESGVVKPGALQEALAARLRALGYPGAQAAPVRPARAEWDLVAAAQAARSKGAAAAVVCSVSLVEGSPEPRRAQADESVYSDAAGRRTYYKKDLYGESYRGPRVRAEVAFVDVAREAVVYRAEIEIAARDLTEETLARFLLQPLEG